MQYVRAGTKDIDAWLMDCTPEARHFKFKDMKQKTIFYNHHKVIIGGMRYSEEDFELRNINPIYPSATNDTDEIHVYLVMHHNFIIDLGVVLEENVEDKGYMNWFIGDRLKYKSELLLKIMNQ